MSTNPLCSGSFTGFYARSLSFIICQDRRVNDFQYHHIQKPMEKTGRKNHEIRIDLIIIFLSHYDLKFNVWYRYIIGTRVCSMFKAVLAVCDLSLWFS